MGRIIEEGKYVALRFPELLVTAAASNYPVALVLLLLWSLYRPDH